MHALNPRDGSRILHPQRHGLHITARRIRCRSRTPFQSSLEVAHLASWSETWTSPMTKVAPPRRMPNGARSGGAPPRSQSYREGQVAAGPHAVVVAAIIGRPAAAEPRSGSD